MSVDPSLYLIVSGLLFAVGLVGVLVRRNVLVVLMSIEIMLNGSNLAFITFSRVHRGLDGQVVAFFVIAVAAAEAAVGLAIVINVFRHFRSTNVDELKALKD
ncbi:MAG: NADH-quinone oxidoreductase subunit NuoK [Bradymonadales bacterium]|nr:NADH-quinone oxidoreductase subunit NuoK [Bradymonadales bacterium]